MSWVPIPNKHDGDGFRSIMSRKDGLQIFGAWVLLLEVASKCEPRGRLVRSNGQPHTAESIARMTGARESDLAKAIAYLSSPDVAWLVRADDCSVEAPAIGPADQKRAHGRLNRALSNGDPVLTPCGILTCRPPACQWCSAILVVQGKGFPSIVAHHLLGYGNPSVDTAVIFVCRSCHGLMETGSICDSEIFSRFGTSWLSRLYDRAAAIGPGQGATQSQVAATSHARAERNGIEGNGTERESTSSRTHAREAAPEPAEDEPGECLEDLKSALEAPSGYPRGHLGGLNQLARPLYDAWRQGWIRLDGTEPKNGAKSMTCSEVMESLAAWKTWWEKSGREVPNATNWIGKGLFLEQAPTWKPKPNGRAEDIRRTAGSRDTDYGPGFDPERGYVER